MRPLPALISTATCVLLTSSALAGPPERFRLERPDWPRQDATPPSRPRVEAQAKTVDPLPPEELDDDGGTPPEGYVRIRRTSPGTTTAGGFIFTIAYAPAFYLGVLGATCDPDPFDDRCAGMDDLAPLLVPVFGPLLTIPNCPDNALCGAIFVADALLQAAGVALLVRGLTERSYFARKDTVVSGLRVQALPMSNGLMLGVGGHL